MTSAAEPQDRAVARAVHPGRRWAWWAALILVVAIVVGVFAARWELRARWWAWRLAAADTPGQRQFYLIRLVAITDRSLGALPTLLHDDRAEIRDQAVTVLRKCTSRRAADLLFATLADSDEGVASAAALALAWRPDARGFVPDLTKRLNAQGQDAWAAAIALGRIAGPDAESALAAHLAQSVAASVPVGAGAEPSAAPGSGRPASQPALLGSGRPASQPALLGSGRPASQPALLGGGRPADLPALLGGGRPARPSSAPGSADVLAQVIDSLGLMGSTTGTEHIRAALNDHRPLTRTPHSLASARLAIAGLTADLTRQGLDPAAVLQGSQAEMTVSGIAAHWLRLGARVSSRPFTG